MTTEMLAVLGLVAAVTIFALGGYLGLRAACSDRQRAARKPTGSGCELW